MIDNENLLFQEFEEDQNILGDSAISKMQMNLIMMGFDIEMINKIISIFKIKTEDEAIDYLIKSENGMWNHPFIPKDIEESKEEKNFILEQPKSVMNNVINTIKKNTSFSIRPEEINDGDNVNILNNDYDIIKTNEEDICEICGESKDFHMIKEFKNQKNDNLDNNNKEEDIIFNDNNNNNENENPIIENKSDENIIKESEEKKEEEENKEEEEEKDPNPNECKICMDIMENPIEIENCKHKFCQECFHSYLMNLITNNQIDNISCPKNKCKNKNISENFFSQFLTEQEYYKYRQFKAQNEIARDKKKIFCPLCDSYADIAEGTLESFDSNNPDYIKSTLKCQNGHEFCSCGRPIHEGKCYQDEKEFKDFVVNEKIKKCPKCGFLIKKTKGCNHMTCGNPICRYEFCWLCMQEAVPNHFDYGPCAGKQFFDPDSFEYQLKINHPCLYVIYMFFVGIFLLILFVICCMAIPGLALASFSFIAVFDGELFDNIDNKMVKIIIFFGYVLYGFALENIVYIAWAIVLAGVIICLALLILGIIASTIRFIFNYLCLLRLDDNYNNENPHEPNNIIDEFL